jgi:hypothetical protein
MMLASAGVIVVVCRVGVGVGVGVGAGVGVDAVEGGAGELVAVVKDARRDLNSLFSFLVSVRDFSSESMCILNSTFIEDSLAIF